MPRRPDTPTYRCIGLRRFAGGDHRRVGLTVAVTGPTGDIGISAVEALQLAPEVERIIGMARRPFDPAGPHV